MPAKASAALCLFAKAPIPGQVKTRLTPPLTGDEAASLHGSFVLDALERSATLIGAKGRPPVLDRFLACLPASDHVFFKVLEGRHGVQLIDQKGDDLGGRMANAFHDLFGMGYRRVLLAGTDLPTLPPSMYQQALDALAAHDVVIGPALDGGYYLIGLTRPQPGLSRDVPWSTKDVLASTRARVEQAGLKLAVLPAHRDVDTIDDVRAMMRERFPMSKRTEGALRLLAGRYAELKTR